MLDKKLEPILKTQAQHTGQLVELASDVKRLLDNKTVTSHRLERLEHWAEKAGQRIGVKIDW